MVSECGVVLGVVSECGVVLGVVLECGVGMGVASESGVGLGWWGSGSLFSVGVLDFLEAVSW